MSTGKFVIAELARKNTIIAKSITNDITILGQKVMNSLQNLEDY